MIVGIGEKCRGGWGREGGKEGEGRREGGKEGDVVSSGCFSSCEGMALWEAAEI